MPARYLKPSTSQPILRLGHPRAHMLSGFWPLAEGAGITVNDVAFNTRTALTGSSQHYATGTNSPSWVDSPWGPAISLNGTNQYFTVNNSSGEPFINNNYGTILTAVCPTADGTAAGTLYNMGAVISGSAGDWGIHYEKVAGNNRMVAYAYHGGIQQAYFENITLNQWMSVAWRYDGTNLEIYRDGLLQQQTAALNVDITSDIMYWGRNYNGANYFPGYIAYMATFYRALSQDDIALWAQDPFALLSRQSEKRIFFGATAPAPSADIKWIGSYPDKVAHPRTPASQQLAYTAGESSDVFAINDLRWLGSYPDLVAHPRFSPADQQTYIAGLAPGGQVRETQAPVEDMEVPSTLLARATQMPVEDLEIFDRPQARISQMVVEVLIPFSCAITPPAAGCPEDVQALPIVADDGCSIPFDPTGT